MPPADRRPLRERVEAWRLDCHGCDARPEIDALAAALLVAVEALELIADRARHADTVAYNALRRMEEC